MSGPDIAGYLMVLLMIVPMGICLWIFVVCLLLATVRKWRETGQLSLPDRLN